jgi:hypothetical protein
MIPVPTGTKWVACGPTDMRRGFDGLAMMVQSDCSRLIAPWRSIWKGRPSHKWHNDLADNTSSYVSLATSPEPLMDSMNGRSWIA